MIKGNNDVVRCVLHIIRIREYPEKVSVQFGTCMPVQSHEIKVSLEAHCKKNGASHFSKPQFSSSPLIIYLSDKPTQPRTILL